MLEHKVRPISIISGQPKNKQTGFRGLSIILLFLYDLVDTLSLTLRCVRCIPPKRCFTSTALGSSMNLDKLMGHQNTEFAHIPGYRGLLTSKLWKSGYYLPVD